MLPIEGWKPQGSGLRGWKLFLHEETGMANMLVTLLVMPILLFMAFAIVPVFVYAMKGDHLSMAANHALKEAEAVGYVSPEVQERLRSRLAELGLDAVTVDGEAYPDFSGSTTSIVMRDAADPTVRLVLKYPAPNLSRMLGAIGGSGGGQTHEGFYYMVLHGRSEAYE